MVELSIFALVGLILGGVLGWIINKFVKQVNKLYVYSGSLVLGLIIFEVIPESTGTYDQFGLLISILLGIVFMHEIHLLTESFHIESKKNNAISFGAFFLVIAIAIHNFPAGIAISSNWINNQLSNDLTASFIIHQIPEGLALFLSLVSASSALYSIFSFITFSFLIVSCFFLALLLGEQSFFQDNRLRAIFMGISIGSLSYVSVFELIAKPYSKLKFSHFAQFLSLGIITVLLFMEFIQVH